MAERTLTVLQFNDLHGYIEPYSEVFRDYGGFNYETCGGLARIATVFKQPAQDRRACQRCLTSTFFPAHPVRGDPRGRVLAI